MKKTLGKPENWQDFESLCKKLWGEIFSIPNKIKKNGRLGQEQAGVDVYGIPKGENKYWGIQAKGKDDYSNAKLSEKEILNEIEKAKKFQPELAVYIIASTTNGDMLKQFSTGTTENWGGNRCRLQFTQQFFPNNDAAQDSLPPRVAKKAGDDRALFYTWKRKPSIEDESSFGSGYAYVKFLNVHSDGSQVHHTQFVDTDFPMLRMAEAYLIYAEADARINGGSCTPDGVEKLNTLRTRAHAKALTSADLDVLCSEWSREFGFEAMRRTTLIRFNKYGGQSAYKWQWEGGEENGKSFDAHYNIFAIPASDMNANSENLKQNPGY